MQLVACASRRRQRCSIASGIGEHPSVRDQILVEAPFGASSIRRQ